MSGESEAGGTAVPPEPGTGAGAEAPSFRAPGVETESPAGGGLPGVLRFFVVPLALVGVSIAVFAGLGALVDQGPPRAEDLVHRIATGGKNARWQAAQELSNQVRDGTLDPRHDAALSAAVATAFARARSEGDDPRVIEYLSRLLGRSDPAVAGPVLREALADGTPDVRLYVVSALTGLGDPRDVDGILGRLEDLDPAVRSVAAFSAASLAAAGGGPVRPGWCDALRRALADPSVDVRWNAALGLARLGDASGADLLWSMLHRDYVRANLRTADGPGAGGFFALSGADPSTPEQREEAVILNALSAAYRLRDRSMAEGVRALARADPSDVVKDWALRASEELEGAIAKEGPVPQRTWVAAR
jgi:hypothetical protein